MRFLKWPSGPTLWFMKLSVVLSGVMLLGVGNACSTKSTQGQGVASGLYEQFEAINLADSLHLGIQYGKELNIPLGAPELFQAFTDSQLRQIYFEYDSAVTQTFAVGKFPLGDGQEACLFRMTESWWVFLGMGVYDVKQGEFSGVYPLASLYGGDGGQEIRESWVTLDPGGRGVAFVTHALDRWMEIREDDVFERKVHAFERRRWNGSGFEAEALSDSVHLVKVFPIDW